MAQRVRLSRTHKSCRLRCAFVAKDGVEYEREFEVMPREFEQYSEGEAVDVVYDSQNPEKNMLKTAVQDARNARHDINAPR